MTQQHTLERRPKKIDLNLLPAEYRPPQKSFLGIAIYLIVFLLACVLVVIIIMKVGVDSDAKSLNQDLTSLQQQLAVLQANKAEADAVKAQITAAQDQLTNMEADYQSFVVNRSSWSQIIAEIDDLLPGTTVTISSIGTSSKSSEGNPLVTLVGTSTKRNYVYEYVLDLEASDFFKDVDFNFGDCPDTEKCNFTITAPLETTNQDAGETNE